MILDDAVEGDFASEAPSRKKHSMERQVEVPTAIDYDSNPEVTENGEIITPVSSVSPRPPPQPSTDTIKI